MFLDYSFATSPSMVFFLLILRYLRGTKEIVYTLYRYSSFICCVAFSPFSCFPPPCMQRILFSPLSTCAKERVNFVECDEQKCKACKKKNKAGFPVFSVLLVFF